MRKFKTHRCPVCDKVYKELGAFDNHMRNEHPGEVPAGWSIYRYTYFLHTGINSGKCRVCGAPTAWNENTGKYLRICDNPECKKKFRNEFMANMRARRGTANPMDDPKVREKMLMNRKISGMYTFADGGRVPYMGKLELGFLQMLDTFFRFPSADIMAPSPNRYTYWYENPSDPDRKGEHMYIPDFYIPSINLEIEIKSAKNERPDHLQVDVVRDAFKDIAMIRNPAVNYVKIYEEDYHVFFQVFADFANQLDNGHYEPIKYISRSLLSSSYLSYIPDDCLKIIRKYVYKYSEKAVLKKAAEADAFPYFDDEEDPNIDMEQQEEPGDITDIYAGEVHEAREDAEIEDAEENGDSEVEVAVGLNPDIFYALNFDPQEGPVDAVETELTMFNFDDDRFTLYANAMEADIQINTNSVAGQTAKKYLSWKDKLYAGKAGAKLAAKAFVKVQVIDNRINISGINCNLLVYRMQEFYDEKKLQNIFEYVYHPASWKAYQNKSISRGQLKISRIYSPVFFALELITIFKDLSKRYRDSSYSQIADMIYEASWLSKADTIRPPDVDLSPLSNLSLELLPHQKEFIRQWNALKARLHMNGYILAFKPGKGKTLTAIGLAECIKASKVYIICPNALKENWALEIRKYYSKYSDENLWRHDVCVLGEKYANPNGAHFIITNNENLKLMQSVAQADPNSMIILDESHNFRNYEGTRSAELFKLADTIGSHNVLCMSATPIKAAPSEITPVLRLIDPSFTDEAASMYARCFALSDLAAMKIIEHRFGLIMYRPADVKVDLPPKTVLDLPFTLQNEDRYYLSNVHDEIISNFKGKLETWLKANEKYVAEFQELIRSYSTATKEITNGYLEWVLDSMTSLKNSRGYHELTVKEYMAFIATYIETNRKCPVNLLQKMKQMEATIVKAAKSAMGKAVGEILPPRRNEMYIGLFTNHIDQIVEMIRTRTKKTVIFSIMVPTVEAIWRGLNNVGIKTVMITGETQNRLGILNQFRNDPDTLCLVATSQTLGVGLTLTEASQMFFFGPPWRSTDFEQACDRIWRIGQTDPVNIWKVILASKRKNLSGRMEEILAWSNEMFDAAISVNEITGAEEVTPAQEGLISDFIHNLSSYDPTNELIKLYGELSRMKYGMMVNGKLVGPDTVMEDGRTADEYEFTVMEPKDLARLKGGNCFDYANFAWSRLTHHKVPTDIYFIIAGQDESCHSTTISKIGDLYYHLECADKLHMGIFVGHTIDELISRMVNQWYTEKSWKRGRPFGVFKITDPKKTFHLTFRQYVNSIVSGNNGQEIDIKYDPKITYCDNIITKSPAVESSLTDWRQDDDTLSRYIPITDPREMEFLDRLRKVFIYTSTKNHRYLDMPRLRTDSIMNPNGIDFVSRDTVYTDWDLLLYMGCMQYRHCKSTMMGLIEFRDPLGGEWFYKLMPMSFAFNGAIICDPTICPGGESMYFSRDPSIICSYFFNRYHRYKGRPMDWNKRIEDLEKSGHPVYINLYLLDIPTTNELTKISPTIMDFIRQFEVHAAKSELKFERNISDIPRMEVMRRGVFKN